MVNFFTFFQFYHKLNFPDSSYPKEDFLSKIYNFHILRGFNMY